MLLLQHHAPCRRFTLGALKWGLRESAGQCNGHDTAMACIAAQVCDTLSELAGKIPDVDKTWPELLPFIFSCVQSGDTRLMEAALNVFADLARSIMTTLMQYMGTLHQAGPCLHPMHL